MSKGHIIMQSWFCKTYFLQQEKKTFHKRLILDSSKFKEFADNNFKFNENGEKISKKVENTVGKGEIARYEQFLCFPVFSKYMYLHSRYVKKQGLIWEGVTVLISQMDMCTYSLHHTGKFWT